MDDYRADAGAHHTTIVHLDDYRVPTGPHHTTIVHLDDYRTPAGAGTAAAPATDRHRRAR